MLTIFGLAIIVALIYFLLTDKMSPMVSLIIVPFVGIMLYWGSVSFYSSYWTPKIQSPNYVSKVSKRDITKFYETGFQNIKEAPKLSFEDTQKFYNEGLKTIKNIEYKYEISQENIKAFYKAGLNAILNLDKYKTLNLDIKEIEDIYSSGIKTILSGSFGPPKMSLETLKKFYEGGIRSVFNIAILFIFAILFFGVLGDVGLFRPLMNFIAKHMSQNVILVCIGTVLIACIAHLDGSGSTTFLLVIPPLLPIYKKLKMSPYLLFLLVASSAGIVNMLPWGGPLGRVSSVLGISEPQDIFEGLIPVVFVGLLCVLIMAVILGLREKRRIAKSESLYKDEEPFFDSLAVNDSSLERPRLLWVNFAVFILTLSALIFKWVPNAYAFMLGLCIVLLINYRTPKERLQRISAHSSGAITMGTVVLAAGTYLGILRDSNMLESIALNIASILPDLILPFLHIIIGVLGVPLELVLNTDAYYFTLFPIVEQITSIGGVDSIKSGYAVMVGSIVGTFVSPFSPALWLGLGLANLSMGRHIAYSFFWIWGLALIIFFISMALGVFSI